VTNVQALLYPVSAVAVGAVNATLAVTDTMATSRSPCVVAALVVTETDVPLAVVPVKLCT